MSARAWPTGLPLVDKLRSCMLQNVPPQSSGSCSSLPYDAAELIHDLYDALDHLAASVEAENERGIGVSGTLMSDMREARKLLARARGEQSL